MRRVWIIAIVLITLAVVRAVVAHEVIQGNDCVIESGQTLEGNVLALCRTFVHNGNIEGDLFLATLTAEINGPVRGNIYTLAGQLDVHDQVGRDLIFAGPVVRVHPTASFDDTRGGIISLGLSTEIAAGAKIPGSILSLGYQLIMAGEVGREISFWGSALTLDGQVHGNVAASVGDSQSDDSAQLQTLLVPFRFNIELEPPGLAVTEGASLDGQLTYTAAHQGTIEGDLKKPAIFKRIITAPAFTQINLDEESNAAWLTSYLSVVIREFVTLASIGLIAILLLPRPIQAPLQHLRARPLSSFGIGLLTFILSFAVWLVVLLILVLVILLFLALRLTDLVIVGLMAIGLFNIGGAGMFYFAAIYVSRALVCLFGGRILVRATLGDDGTPRMLYLNLLVGVAVFSALAFLPFIGGMINVLGLVLGLGATFLAVTQWRNLPRRRPMPAAAHAMRQIPPPPIVDEATRGRGMENLPAGFRWWDND